MFRKDFIIRLIEQYLSIFMTINMHFIDNYYEVIVFCCSFFMLYINSSRRDIADKMLKMTLNKHSNTTGVISTTGTAYLSGAHAFTSGLLWGSCCSVCSFRCSILQIIVPVVLFSFFIILFVHHRLVGPWVSFWYL